jgi:hypothetical protein
MDKIVVRTRSDTKNVTDFSFFVLYFYNTLKPVKLGHLREIRTHGMCLSHLFYFITFNYIAKKNCKQAKEASNKQAYKLALCPCFTAFTVSVIEMHFFFFLLTITCRLCDVSLCNSTHPYIVLCFRLQEKKSC